VLFFGYARQGALVTPVVALLAALAIARWGGPLAARMPDRRAGLAIALALAVPVLLEAARWLQRPQVAIDGRTIGATDPFPPGDHRDQAVAVR
jgi:hypothetical protein